MGSENALQRLEDKVFVASNVAKERDAKRSAYGLKRNGEDVLAYPLIRFFNMCREMPFENMDSQNIIAMILEKRSDFERDLELLVERLSDVSGSIRAALFTVAIVFGRVDLMEEIRRYEEKQWNVIWDDDTVFGWSPAHYAIFLRQPDYLEFCIDAGVDVNTSDGNRQTLLIAAVKGNSIPMVEYLLEHVDIQPFSRDKLRGSALTYAKAGGNQKIISLLTSVVDEIEQRKSTHDKRVSLK